MSATIFDTRHEARPIKIDRLAGYLHRAREAHVIEKRREMRRSGGVSFSV